jgi:hypothetical protein
MGLFRRQPEETLNERLLREAGLDAAQPTPKPGRASEPGPEPEQPAPADPYAGTYPADHGIGIWTRAMARPGQYDATFTTRADGIPGDEVEFATLPSGDIIVDTEQGDADLSPLADAAEQHVNVPYRVVARRQGEELWFVAVREIDVLELDFDSGDEIELSSQGGVIDLRVDGEPSNGRIPELEHAGEAAKGEDYVVQAERLDGTLWEIRLSAL